MWVEKVHRLAAKKTAPEFFMRVVKTLGGGVSKHDGQAMIFTVFHGGMCNKIIYIHTKSLKIALEEAGNRGNSLNSITYVCFYCFIACVNLLYLPPNCPATGAVGRSAVVAPLGLRGACVHRYATV